MVITVGFSIQRLFFPATPFSCENNYLNVMLPTIAKRTLRIFIQKMRLNK